MEMHIHIHAEFQNKKRKVKIFILSICLTKSSRQKNIFYQNAKIIFSITNIAIFTMKKLLKAIWSFWHRYVLSLTEISVETVWHGEWRTGLTLSLFAARQCTHTGAAAKCCVTAGLVRHNRPFYLTQEKSDGSIPCVILLSKFLVTCTDTKLWYQRNLQKRHNFIQWFWNDSCQVEVFQINLNSRYLFSEGPNVHKYMTPVICYIVFFFL